MAEHIKVSPQGVHAALEAISETFADYVPLCLEAGADGLFFATLGWGTYDRMTTDQEYQEFGRQYDLRVLQAARDAWFNVLHVCRGNNMLRALSDYPVHAFNWDAHDPSNATLAEGVHITRKGVIGGIPQKEIATMSPDEVKATVRECLAQTRGERFMLGSGCTMSTRTPERNLLAIKEALSEGS